MTERAIAAYLAGDLAGVQAAFAVRLAVEEARNMGIPYRSTEGYDDPTPIGHEDRTI